MRITTKKGRDFAFKLRRIRNDRTGKKRWFVGITTKEYFWLDLSAALGTTALWMAKELAKRLNTNVYVFVTTKSYWLVTKKKLSKEEWDREFKYWLGFPESFVCHAFCECCIRYHKATLRVSAKKGKRPKLIMKVINRLENSGLPANPRLRDFPKSQRVEALPITVSKKMNINTSVSWLLNTVLFIGEQGINNALNPYGLQNLNNLDQREKLVYVYRGILRMVRRNAGFLRGNVQGRANRLALHAAPLRN